MLFVIGFFCGAVIALLVYVSIVAGGISDNNENTFYKEKYAALSDKVVTLVDAVDSGEITVEKAYSDLLVWRASENKLF